MGDTFHATRTYILIYLIDALVRLDSNGTVWADSGTGGTLDASLELSRLVAEIRINLLNIADWVENSEADDGAVFRGLDDDSGPTLVWKFR